MLRVALTGGIATGKSFVLSRLADRGIAVIDADDIVHRAFGPDTPTTRAIAERFGAGFLRPDGSVHRALLGIQVFADADARRQIEAIVHPVVYESIRTWFDTLDRPMGVASIPLLYETGHDEDFDFVVVTVCPPAVQLQRLLERDRLSEDEAQQRISAQMPAEEKAARGDFAIFTGGTKHSTDRQVDELVAALGRLMPRV